jgi:uncharacterized protein with PIN domain
MTNNRLETPKTIRFVADVMLGALARQLLFAGYDCRYFHRIEDQALAEIARREERVLLTRDRKLFESSSRSPAPSFLKATSTREQMVHLTRSLPLEITEGQLFSRCVNCNRELRTVALEEVRTEVPEETRDWVDEYSQCPKCGKIYWRGTHTQAIRDKFSRWGILPHP